MLLITQCMIGTERRGLSILETTGGADSMTKPVFLLLWGTGGERSGILPTNATAIVDQRIPVRCIFDAVK